MVYWESTRACDLVCRHCRADAVVNRDPCELTTAQVKKLFDEVKRFGDSHLVVTGGDPMKRTDLFELIEYAGGIGLTISLTPSGTTSITRQRIWKLKELGISTIALSFDGPTAEKHDKFRGVNGCFDQTYTVARWVNEAGIPLQINTTVTGETKDDLPDLYQLVRSFNASRWSLFFLIPVGRGASLGQINSEECERMLNWIYELSVVEKNIVIKTTEAPHYRRVILQRGGSLGSSSGIRDGNGIVFISHTGDIYPSGFLPVKAGNILNDSLVGVYRKSPIFTNLRDVSKLNGKCGVCEFRNVCGGSRARAYAESGDYMGSDNLCLYVPSNVTVKGNI